MNSTRKQKQHESYLRRRELLGAEEIRRRNRESYLRNRERTLAHQREYYHQNSERVIKRTSEYQKVNPDVNRRARKKFYQLHREQILKKQSLNREGHRPIARKSYRKHREKRLEASREWRKRNRQYFQNWENDNRLNRRAQRREHYKNNRSLHQARAAVKSSKRRAIKKNAEIHPASIKGFMMRTRLAKSINCFWCGWSMPGKKVHFDHIIALANGGSHSVENLCASCPECNLKKGAKGLSQWNKVKSEPQMILI